MYTFKLQSVLDHRQLIEDSIKKEIADIRKQIIENQRQLESLMQKESDTVHTLKMEQAQGLASDRVVAYHTFLGDLSKRITGKQREIDSIRAQEAEKQNELLEAMKKRQILEKLKEQGMDRYREGLLRHERTFIDEIAVNQFVRSQLSGNGEGE